MCRKENIIDAGLGREGYGEEGDSCAGDGGGVSASHRDVDEGIRAVQSQSRCLGCCSLGRRDMGGFGGVCSTQVWLGQLLLGWAEGGHSFASNCTGVSPRARRKVRVSSVLVLC